jgi:tRNA (pseudouridine54-N1)-methyltransferase
MRHFIYFSSSAATSGNALSKYSDAGGDLMKAGRMDIAIHSFIQGVFLSHALRENVIFHFVFYGMPDPPKHITIQVKTKKGVPETGQEVGSIDISKKDVGTLIKKILYKYRKDEKTEVFSGCFIEKKNLFNVIEELIEQGNEIFILDKNGEDIRKAKIPKNCAFVLGDHDGLPKKELNRLKEYCTPISVGPLMYFASQTVAVVNNELDRRGI